VKSQILTVSVSLHFPPRKLVQVNSISKLSQALQGQAAGDRNAALRQLEKFIY